MSLISVAIRPFGPDQCLTTRQRMPQGIIKEIKLKLGFNVITQQQALKKKLHP